MCELPARALLDASADAKLLVVGWRGIGRPQGSAPRRGQPALLHHTTIPIAIVRHHQAGDGPIVSAVDGSKTAEHALAWAVEEAGLRSAPLRAVNAWHRRVVGAYPDAEMAVDPGDYERAAHEIVTSALESVETAELATPVEMVVRQGGPAEVVLAASKGAELMVMRRRAGPA